MATYNLGRFLLIFKGTYNNSIEYEPLDVVYSNGSSYVALQSSRGRQPQNSPLYWQILAAKGEISPTLTQEQVNSIVAQIESDKNWVSDSEYTHTDNNFTDEYINKINNIGDGAVNIKRNGVKVGEFNVNQSTTTDININVPTQISQLAGGDNFTTKPNIKLYQPSEYDGIIKVEENTKYIIIDGCLDSVPFIDITETPTSGDWLNYDGYDVVKSDVYFTAVDAMKILFNTNMMIQDNTTAQALTINRAENSIYGFRAGERYHIVIDNNTLEIYRLMQ